MMNTYRAFEVASGFEPLYEVLQTTAQPLGYATVLKRRKDNNLFLNNANLFSKKVDFFLEQKLQKVQRGTKVFRTKVIKGTKKTKVFCFFVPFVTFVLKKLLFPFVPFITFVLKICKTN
jgi:hypothetical protein